MGTLGGRIIGIQPDKNNLANIIFVDIMGTKWVYSDCLMPDKIVLDNLKAIFINDKEFDASTGVARPERN